jgi:hypothetical protein
MHQSPDIERIVTKLTGTVLEEFRFGHSSQLPFIMTVKATSSLTFFELTSSLWDMLAIDTQIGKNRSYLYHHISTY